MMKRELLDYIDGLINKLQEEKRSIPENALGDLIFLYKKINSSLENIEYLKHINLEMLDDYINVPYDVLNILTLYQHLSVSKNYPLTQEQKQYVIYLLQEFKTLLEKKLNEFKESSVDYQNLDNQINNLNSIKTILISKVNITLDDYVLIVQIIKNIREDYNSKLLENVSLYMRDMLITRNQIQFEETGKSK